VLQGLLLVLLLPLASILHARTITETDRQHWSFQPLKEVRPPAIVSEAIQNPIDRFVLAKLQTNHLEFTTPATKEQLIRRVSFDLIGLPPTVAETDAFLRDSSPRAYEKLLDRLLASPHYGERWGRHWLDLARFAESDGFEHDAVRPHSWRYRDYVINSFNADKPYDRFIREQLAGDELFPNDPQAVVATGFNLLGPDMVDSADQVQRRHNTLNDMTDTAALVFLGQTIGCARCHNHKSEPFSQADYYQLQAFFSAAKFERELPVPTVGEREAHQSAIAKYDQLTQTIRQQIEAIEAPYRARLYDEKLAKLSEEARLAHQTPKEKRTVEMENQIQETVELLKVSDTELLKSIPKEEKAKRYILVEQLKKFPRPAPLPVAMGLQASAKPEKTFVLARGDYNNPGEEVQPGFPEILRGSSGKVGAETQPRRAILANWIASPENPLTARVMVNRIWQHHFGRGVAPSPSELGTRAERPTHPELLEWLAQRFVNEEWSIKKIHKLILLSATYQQSSDPSAETVRRDPENQLFSRQNRQRLEGEMIRDGLLAVSGALNYKVGGPSVFPPLPADIEKGAKNWVVSQKPTDQVRRSLYIFAQRNLRYPFLEVFDAPDNNLTCPQRGHSTTAPQSLTLLNSEQVMQAAKATAARMQRTSNDDVISSAFRLIVGRPPSSTERTLSRQFLQACSSRRQEDATSNASDHLDIAELCRALFNLNAFVYVD
jgi:hypothetical protein